MCGIAGAIFPSVAGQTKDVNPAEITLTMMAGLQHRGHTAAGIAGLKHGEGKDFQVEKGKGRVFDAITKEALYHVSQSHALIGHVLYQTSGDRLQENIQPLMHVIHDGDARERIAVAHNGNLVNELEGGRPSDSDSWCFLEQFSGITNHQPLHLRIHKSLKNLSGAYSLIYLHQSNSGKVSMVCVRDPHGFRPLYIGKIYFQARGNQEVGYVVASETNAFDRIGRVVECRKVQRGEIIIINEDGLKSFISQSQDWKNAPRRACIFEGPYFKHPASQMMSKKTLESLELREKLGETAILEFMTTHPDIAFDAIDGIPDSSTYHAIGASRASGVELERVIVRNHDVGRTFIRPQNEITEAVLNKFGFSKSKIKRLKSLVLMDDSIVRGNTMKGVIRYLKRINPKLKIHVVICFPPIKCPCFFGIATTTVKELGYHMYGGIDGIREEIGADTLYYISLEGFFATVEEATGYGREAHCHACITTELPVPVERHGYKRELAQLRNLLNG